MDLRGPFKAGKRKWKREGKKEKINERKKLEGPGENTPRNKFLVTAVYEQFVTSSDSLGNTTTPTPLVSDSPATFNAWHWYCPACSSLSLRIRNLDPPLLVTWRSSQQDVFNQTAWKLKLPNIYKIKASSQELQSITTVESAMRHCVAVLDILITGAGKRYNHL